MQDDVNKGGGSGNSSEHAEIDQWGADNEARWVDANGGAKMFAKTG